MAKIDPHAHQALTASAAGRDADPWLRAYLDARRTSAQLDAAGIVAIGVDGRARVRAWSGRGATRIAEAIDDPWAGGDPFPASALGAVGLGSAAITVCGSRALLVAARRASTAPPPLPSEPLIDALLELEQGRAATNALGAAAALVSTTHARPRSGGPWRARWTSASRAVRRRPSPSRAPDGASMPTPPVLPTTRRSPPSPTSWRSRSGASIARAEVLPAA